MRILLCIDSLGVGGKERQAVELIKGLASVPEVGCRVVCFEASDFYLDDLMAAGVSVDFLIRQVRWDAGVFRKLRRVIKSYRPDVIYTNGLVSSFYGLPLAKLWRVPIVNGSIRNAFTEGGFRWALERLLLRLSDYRIANSRAGLRSRNFSEQDPRNFVIHNGFDLDRIEYSNGNRKGAQIASHAPTSRRIVGMVAEFNRNKDYWTFIEAARILSAWRHDVVFVAVGAGETLTECQAAAQDLQIINFLGQRKDVEDLVASFEIGVLCSFVEGLSNSIMEYMAFAKPVVATDGGGTPELVVDGETGLVVTASEPSAVASAVHYLLEHPDVAMRMGRAGRAKLLNEFSRAQMIAKTVAVYRQAIDNFGDRNRCRSSSIV